MEGLSAPTVFHNLQTGTRCVVHGEEMAEPYELMVRGILGTDDGEAKSISILNKEVAVTDAGLKYPAESQHAQTIRAKMGLMR